MPCCGQWFDIRGLRQVSEHPRSPKVFSTTDAAEKCFEENDTEGVAFEYEVLE
jgi:hypothetical protein